MAATSDLEGLPQDQPRQHPRESVSRDQTRRPTLAFHQLHAECQTRIQQKALVPDPQPRSPEAKKSSKASNSRKAATSSSTRRISRRSRVDSTRVINLEKFTDADAIDDIYLERPHTWRRTAWRMKRSRSSARHEGKGRYRQGGALAAGSS